MNTNKFKKHLLTSDEKLEEFGYGEWVEEVDALAFIYKGYACKVIRNLDSGALCGYVKIPDDHPDYNKKHYHDFEIECHGGLTFWGYKHIGFDCAHSCDFVPAIQFIKNKYRNLFPIPEEFKDLALFNLVYRNIEYVKSECKKIVNQLIKIAKKENVKNG